MKKDSNGKNGLREGFLVIGVLFLVGLVWIFGELFPYMVGFDLALMLLIPFAIMGLVWRVVRLFRAPDGQERKELIHPRGVAGILWEMSKDTSKEEENELPWAERVRQGLEPLEKSDEPRPEDLPWAEKVRRGLASLEISDAPTPGEMPWAERVRAGLERLTPEETPAPEDHDHIPSTELEKEEKLEQLKVLLNAGLIDREEYEQRKKAVKKGRNA